MLCDISFTLLKWHSLIYTSFSSSWSFSMLSSSNLQFSINRVNFYLRLIFLNGIIRSSIYFPAVLMVKENISLCYLHKVVCFLFVIILVKKDSFLFRFRIIPSSSHRLFDPLHDSSSIAIFIPRYSVDLFIDLVYCCIYSAISIFLMMLLTWNWNISN